MAVNVKVTQSIDMEQLLKQLPIELRVGALSKAVRAGGKVVIKRAKELVPRGDPTHKPDKKALKDTIGQVVRSYRNDRKWMAVVGPMYPAGAHGHLVEYGHDVKVNRGERKGRPPLTGSAKVPGKEFLAPAADQTETQQGKAVIQIIVDAIKDAGG